MRTRKREAEITGEKDGFALGDLRWLVAQTEGLNDDETIRLYYDAGASGAYSQFDRGYATLSIQAEED